MGALNTEDVPDELDPLRDEFSEDDKYGTSLDDSSLSGGFLLYWGKIVSRELIDSDNSVVWNDRIFSPSHDEDTSSTASTLVAFSNESTASGMVFTLAFEVGLASEVGLTLSLSAI